MVATWRYTDTATFQWLGAGTFNSVGMWSTGTLATLGVVCNIQPADEGVYVIGAGGVRLDYSWRVFAPRFTGDDAIPADAKLVWGSVERAIVRLTLYRRHVEVRCQD